MHRPAVLFFLLLLSWNCHAGCNVAVAGADTISLRVGKGACFSSARQRQAFASELKRAVRTMEATGKGSLGKSSADQLNGFGDLKRQARHLSPAPPVYYGQR